MITLLLRLVTLMLGLHQVAPRLSRAAVAEHVFAAHAAETADAPAELLLAIPGRESNWERDPGGKCGVGQVALHGSACRHARASLRGGYEAMANALHIVTGECRRWRVRDLAKCRDNYYAEGWKAGKRGWGKKCGHRRHRCDRGASIRRRAWRIAHPRIAPTQENT